MIVVARIDQPNKLESTESFRNLEISSFLTKLWNLQRKRERERVKLIPLMVTLQEIIQRQNFNFDFLEKLLLFLSDSSSSPIAKEAKHFRDRESNWNLSQKILIPLRIRERVYGTVATQTFLTLWCSWRKYSARCSFLIRFSRAKGRKKQRKNWEQRARLIFEIPAFPWPRCHILSKRGLRQTCNATPNVYPAQN